MSETISVSWMFCPGEGNLEVVVAGYTAGGCALQQRSSSLTAGAQDPVLEGISRAQPGNTP